MNPGINITVSYPDDRHIQMSCLTPEGKKVSGGRFRKYIANLNGARVKALAAVGIGTEPEYRRYGLVRKMLELSGEIAKNEGYLISILHPFSFAYYRKFGYDYKNGITTPDEEKLYRLEKHRSPKQRITNDE